MSNEIISVSLIFFTTIAGAFGFAAVDEFTQGINDNVDSVNSVVLGVADSQERYQAGEIGIGQFRADWQDAKTYITGKYQDACEDTDLSPEQRALNENYKSYLLECIGAVNEYSEGKEANVPIWDY